MDNTFEANIYTPDHILKNVLKDYISIVWTDRYYDMGDFELELPLTLENLDTFQPNNYIICNQSDKIMIIESIDTGQSAGGFKMIVKGRSAESLLTRRVLADSIVINSTTELDNVFSSHFENAIWTMFKKCFSNDSVRIMTNDNDYSVEKASSAGRRSMPALRYVGMRSDPEVNGHKYINEAIANVDAHGDEFYEIVQDLCSSKDIGFGVYRNFDVQADLDKPNPDLAGAFDFAIYSGFDLTKLVTFSVEYLNLISSSTTASIEDFKNYIFEKGDEIDNREADVDVVTRTANFTKGFTDEDPMYYQIGTASETSDYAIFRRETFEDSGLNRGMNTRYKYANRLLAKGQKTLKTKKRKRTISCEINNQYNYIYRKHYYLGDLVTVKDTMNFTSTMRVTEVIISSDSSGMKVYPTLELFDPDKYVADDSIDETSVSQIHFVKFIFGSGLSPYDDGIILSNDSLGTIFSSIADKYYQMENNVWKKKSNYEALINAAARTETGPYSAIIVDTVPSFDKWTEGIVDVSDSDNIIKLKQRLQGVVTLQLYGDYIVFPEAIGSNVSSDPDVQGEYKLTKENSVLKYWSSTAGHPLSIWTQDISAEEEKRASICWGDDTYTAVWMNQLFRISFDAGDGGRFLASAYANSYALVSECIDEGEFIPFEPGTFYKRKNSLYSPDYEFEILSVMPADWYENFNNYYMLSSVEETGKVFVYAELGAIPKAPIAYAKPGYEYGGIKRNSKGQITARWVLWDPEIVPAEADASYVAQWTNKGDGEPPEEEEPDEEEEEDEEAAEEKKDNSEEAYTNIKHTEGFNKVFDNVYIGDEKDNNEANLNMSMITFRSKKSRLLDDFKLDIQNGRMVKEKDGPDQHDAYLYQRDLSSKDSNTNYILQIYMNFATSTATLGIAILREDGECVLQYANGFSRLSSNQGRNFVPEVAVTTSPITLKVKGYAALTSNPFASSDSPDDSEEDSTDEVASNASAEQAWPQNKIFSKSGNTYTAVNSKPADWDTTWNNYYKYTQIGVKYGFCTQACDDLGITYTPIWSRAGLIDNPIIPFLPLAQTTPYDVKYTSDRDRIITLDTQMGNSISGHYKLNSSYIASGWVWIEVPDARWKGPAHGTSGNITGSSAPKFVYTSKYGGLYMDANQHVLTSMPSDWETNYASYSYVPNSQYHTCDKDDDKLINWQWGTGTAIAYSSGAIHGPGFWNYDRYAQEDTHNGGVVGLHVPLMKAAGNEYSILIQVKGYTQSQEVKVNEPATFSVNASSVIKSATITYQWQTAAPSGSTWENVSGNGSSFTIKPSSLDQNGTKVRCVITANYTIGGETLSATETTPDMNLIVIEGEYIPPTDPYEEAKEKEKQSAADKGSGDEPALTPEQAQNPSPDDSEWTTNDSPEFHSYERDASKKSNPILNVASYGFRRKEGNTVNTYNWTEKQYFDDFNNNPDHWDFYVMKEDIDTYLKRPKTSTSSGKAQTPTEASEFKYDSVTVEDVAQPGFIKQTFDGTALEENGDTLVEGIKAANNNLAQSGASTVAADTGYTPTKDRSVIYGKIYYFYNQSTGQFVKVDSPKTKYIDTYYEKV